MGGQRVLLVDDEPSFLVVMRRMVQRIRPDAIVVYTADVGLAEWQLRSTAIGLVLTDMCLASGDCDGLRVVAAAQEVGVPVAVLSGAQGPWYQELVAKKVPVLSKTSLTTEVIAELMSGGRFAGA